MVLGIFILVLYGYPLISLPGYMKQILAAAAGLLIVIVAYQIKPEDSRRSSERDALPYTEHRNE